MPALMKFLHLLAAIAWLGCISFMLLGVGMKQAPLGWHLMLGLGLLMFAIFGHLYFGPFRQLKRAIQAGNWPEGGRRMGQIAPWPGSTWHWACWPLLPSIS